MFYPNVKKCFEFAASIGCQFLESGLQHALIKLSRLSEVPDRTFVSFVMAAKHSLTARCLNEILSQLIEVSLFCVRCSETLRRGKKLDEEEKYCAVFI